LTKAAYYYRRALKCDVKNPQIYSNLGNALRKMGKTDEAIDCYRRCLLLKPDAWRAHSNLLLALNSHPRSDGGLRAEHIEWAQMHAATLASCCPGFPHDRSPDRKLRIAYRSPDFRRHSVASFVQRMLVCP